MKKVSRAQRGEAGGEVYFGEMPKHRTKSLSSGVGGGYAYQDRKLKQGRDPSQRTSDVITFIPSSIN